MVISLNELVYFNVKYYIDTDDGSIYAMQLENVLFDYKFWYGACCFGKEYDRVYFVWNCG